MSTIDFDPVLFRARFPIYADPIKYPDVLLQDFWNQALCYISNVNYGCYLDSNCRQQLINLMTAHLLTIWNAVNDRDGVDQGSGGQDDVNTVTSASIGDVSVSIQPPPIGDEFDWWINQTPYGKEFSALLSLQSAGGFYLFGSQELLAYRKVGGIF